MASKLAINSGKRAVPENAKIRQWPVVTQSDKDMVMETLDSGELAGATAPQVTALESEFADYIGSDYCIAMQQWDSCSTRRCSRSRRGHGDEVITSAYSFS